MNILARYLRVGDGFRYLGGLYTVLSVNNKGTVGAVQPHVKTIGTYLVLSGNRTVRV
jgi:hypothetical protein